MEKGSCIRMTIQDSNGGHIFLWYREAEIQGPAQGPVCEEWSMRITKPVTKTAMQRYKFSRCKLLNSADYWHLDSHEWLWRKILKKAEKCRSAGLFKNVELFESWPKINQSIRYFNQSITDSLKKRLPKPDLIQMLKPLDKCFWQSNAVL